MLIDIFLAGVVLVLIQERGATGVVLVLIQERGANLVHSPRWRGGRLGEKKVLLVPWISTSTSQACLNGGTPSYNGSTLECTCPKYTSGRHCENMDLVHSLRWRGGRVGEKKVMLVPWIGNSTPQTCLNGGTPSYNGSALGCACPKYTSGSYCENADLVHSFRWRSGRVGEKKHMLAHMWNSNSTSQTCMNGGTPSYSGSTLECVCPKYTSGSHCENTNCSLFECYNNGTVVTRDDYCECSCPVHFTGLVCETELFPSKWPDGPYALLMPTSGCPESTNHGWGAGFIHFTVKHKMEIWREFNYSNEDVNRTHLAENTSALAGPFQNYSLKLNFCFKHRNSSVTNSSAWPPLKVTVFGDIEGCPRGFDEEMNYLVLPQLRSWWDDGYLPYFDIRSDGDETLLITKHCHLNESEFNDTRHVENTEPFILVKEYEHRCPSVKDGFDIEDETIQFISASDNSTGKRFQTNLSFCVYKQDKVNENETYLSTWPSGPYAVLMTNTGCPEPLSHGWKVGYMQFEERYQTFENFKFYECQDVTLFGSLLEVYHLRDHQMFFCFKYGQQANEVPWPQGNYSIFGTYKGCPEGFQENHRYTRTPRVLSTKEPLPFYNKTSRHLGFMYCDKKDEYSKFSSDWKKPFAFPLPPGLSCMKAVKGFSVRPEGSYLMRACIYIPLEKKIEVCADHDFRCEDGRCIRFAHRCDHKRDCDKGEDEINCTYSCDKDKLSCYNKCLHTFVPCDGAQNCTDNIFDPDNLCGLHKTDECYKYELKCGSGECVKKIHVCDDIKDCRDGSDELSENCGLRCARNTLLIRDESGQFCSSKRTICDGRIRCNGCMDDIPSSCPLVCNRDEVYMGITFRRNRQRPVCMSAADDTEPETALGLRAFCNNMDRCRTVRDVCNELLPRKRPVNDVNKQPRNTCQRALGLKDGSITDSQLVASSYEEGHYAHMTRPYKSSWCPLKNDPLPFLEVLLNYVTVIGGIIVFNSVESGGYIVNNIYIPEAIPVGSGSFSIQYALFQSKYRQYSNKLFEVDESKEISKPHKFTFLRPFLARYVRIYPRTKILNGSLCLRLELLGCPQSDDTELISLKNIEEFDVLLSEPYRLSSIIRPSNKIYRWNITVPECGYIKLSFLTINLYNPSRPSDLVAVPGLNCHSGRFCSFDRDYAPFQELKGLQTESCPHDLISINALFEPITAQYNNHTPVYPTDQTSLLMTFVSCIREEGISSFEVVFNKEDVPTVWGNVKNINFREGRLITFSFLGLFVNLPRGQFWVLNSFIHGSPLVLTIEGFNIPCDIGFRLFIYKGHGVDEGFCNTDRRPRKTYKTWYLKIEFLYNEKGVSQHDPEGFSAVYQIETATEKYKLFYSNEGYEPPTDLGQLGAYTVYSQTGNKHYRFSYKKTFEDWLTQAKYCQRLNSSLVVIHDRSEMEFLQSWIFYRISKLLATRSEMTKAVQQSVKTFKGFHDFVYFHIGLHRYEGINGLKDIWQDGTSLSYTAWATGEPRNVSSNKCTGMQVDTTKEEGRWVTRACTEETILRPDLMFVSICENTIAKASSVNNTRFSIDAEFRSNATQLQAVRLFRCNSTEWVSIFATCDGIPDCIDGSDELECRHHYTDICSGDMFRCNNGGCIPIGRVCDYISDCADNSDEYCYKSSCAYGEFRCENKQCISNYSRCNAVNDCLDGSDEIQCLDCNETTAFPCNSVLTCIDKSKVCDRHRDCADGNDERNCDEILKSCLGYWKAGYDGKVAMDRNDANIECQFSAAEGILKITTSVDVKQKWIRKFTREVMPLNVKHFTGFGGQCLIQVSVYCPQYITNTTCIPGTYSFYLSNNRFWGRSISRTDKVSIINYRPYKQLAIYKTHKFPRRFVKVHPAECKSDPINTIQYLRCGDGRLVSPDRKCLYDINRDGVTAGCLNYIHLDNCGKFICPSGYFKCPFSFCLAQRHVCDGERQCPGGEDEADCWCNGSRNNIAIIYNEDIDREVVPFIHQFARQLYSQNAATYSVRYLLDSNKRAFNVRKTPVHPYSEGLYWERVERFSVDIDMYKLYEEISNIFNTSEHVDIINIEQYDWLQYKGNFSNSTFIDHVYHVSIKPDLLQRATITKTARQSVLKIKNWKLLASAGSVLFPTLCQAAMSTTCTDQFRCLSSKVCIPGDQICDGTPQCPFEDDEGMCDFQCLPKCSCRLYIVICKATNFTQQDFVDLDTSIRDFDMSETNPFEKGNLYIPKKFPYLITLIAKNCGIISVEGKTFQNATNIRHLDLSFNRIKVITTRTFEGLGRLEVLNLKGNYYIESIQPKAFMMLTSLSALTITETKLREIQADTFWGLNIKILNISHNEIRKIEKLSFNKLSAKEIEFDGNDIDAFDADIFTGIDTVQLKTIRSPAYKLCCVKPPSLSFENCWPHQDEFSSCEDLMRNPVLQTLIWVLGVTAVVANGCTIFYRLIYDRHSLKKGFGVFVTNLAASDFLMGVYMIIIAVADVTFRNRYIMMDDYWRTSAWCDFAGVIATVSSEASVLFMFLITVDRILVIKYPFGQWKFSPKHTKIALIVSWTVSLTIALVPIVVQDYFEGKFYSTSGVCLALPLTHRRPPGWLYSFLIYVALNFVVFILIAVGQLVIYLEIKESSKRMQNVRSQRRNDDIRIAKNLLLVLFTDFLCWFPVGVMAIIAASGYVIPGEIYAWTAVMILPVNAALNPFLYTLSAVIHTKASSVASGVPTRIVPEKKHEKIIVTKDVNIQCNINPGTITDANILYSSGLGKSTVVPDDSKIHVFTPLDERQVGQMVLEPREVLSTSIAAAMIMQYLHENNLVHGGFHTEDVSYSPETRKIKMCTLHQLRSASNYDKEIDVYGFGRVLEHLLKFTQPSN